MSITRKMVDIGAVVATVQFSKIARPFEKANEVVWRAVSMRAPKDLQIVSMLLPKLTVVKVRDFADGTYSVAFTSDVTDQQTVDHILEIEEKAKLRLDWLASNGDADVNAVISGDDEPGDVFISRISPSSKNAHITFDRQVGPRPECISIGHALDVSATVHGVATCRGRRAFSLVFEIIKAVTSRDEVKDDEYEDDEDEYLDGPDPEEIHEIRRGISNNAFKIANDLEQEYAERKNVIDNIKGKVGTARLDELEVLATELELCMLH